LLGDEGSFNSTSTNPWKHIINSNVVGLNNNVVNLDAFTKQFQIKATLEQLSDYLLTQAQEQDVSRAGFYHDGSKHKSATAAITIELEKARMNALGTCIVNYQFHKVTTNELLLSSISASAVPLLSPPDQIGFQEFQMLIVRYLDQPNPFCQHLAGHFFGRNATTLDVYGANLSSESLTRKRT
jgi:hypothetical protein